MTTKQHNRTTLETKKNELLRCENCAYLSTSEILEFILEQHKPPSAPGLTEGERQGEREREGCWERREGETRWREEKVQVMYNVHTYMHIQSMHRPFCGSLVW